MHYQHLEKLSSHILENMQSFKIFNTVLSVHCFLPKEILGVVFFFIYFLVSQIEVGFELHMVRENIQLTGMYSGFVCLDFAHPDCMGVKC